MPSFGEELRRERELRRITLREVADATKINLRYLEALDRNDFQHLPGGVFNRGFVRAYAQYIGVDADQMVSAYLMEVRAQSGTDAGAGGAADPSTDPLLRGSRAPMSGAIPDAASRAAASDRQRTWLKFGLAIVLVVAFIAACAFVYFKYASESGVDSNRTEAAAPTAVRTACTRAPAARHS